jgi:hypothetical protein
MHEYRALGLDSRGAAWAIAIVGLLFSPVIVGIPLVIWGLVADSMLVKHQKALAAQSPDDPHRSPPGQTRPNRAKSLTFPDR